MNDDERLLRLFYLVHGQLSENVGVEIVYDNDGIEPIGVNVMKDGDPCWYASRENLVFEYITRDFQP